MLAVAALAGCAKEETISLNKGEVISFNNSFIDNATRAAIDGSNTTANLTSFYVYGAVETTTNDVYTNIFDGVEVTKEKKNGTDIGAAAGDTTPATWWYAADKVQYWIDGKDYKFAAVVDGTVTAKDAAGMPTELTVDAEAQKDLLYATSDADSGPVAFTFAHLMSKVKFTANVATMASAYSYRVKNITINDVATTGVYTIGATTPWAASGEYDPSFGNIVSASNADGGTLAVLKSDNPGESNWSRLMVPQDITSISFTVELYKGDACIDSTPKNITLTGSDIITLEAGHAYSFNIGLDVPGTPIMFSMNEVTTWDETGGDKPL